MAKTCKGLQKGMRGEETVVRGMGRIESYACGRVERMRGATTERKNDSAVNESLC